MEELFEQVKTLTDLIILSVLLVAVLFSMNNPVWWFLEE